MYAWAAAECWGASLGDLRLKKRLIRLVTDLAAQPSATVPQACGSWAATKGAYRFWTSPRVTPAAILAGHRRSTVARLREQPVVVAVQETTELDVTDHPGPRGVGPLDGTGRAGMKVHCVLGVSRDGVPLGLLAQDIWVRDPAERGKTHQRHQRATHEQESQRWLDALAVTVEVVPPEVAVVTIADREADLSELFALERRPGADLLIRAAHNRRVTHEAGSLWDAISQAPPSGVETVTLPRHDDRPAREATVSIRFLSLAIEPPKNRRGRHQMPVIALQAVLAEEVGPSRGEPPIRWLLLTTLPVLTHQAARRCVEWYRWRWLIERFHFVLKSGCRIEGLHLGTQPQLARAVATYRVVAWRLLWLTYAARQAPEGACDQVLEAQEWPALAAIHAQTTPPPATPPTLREAVRWIAQLGGFLGRRRDGEPGVQVLWRGLRRLHDIAATWTRLHPDSPPEDTS